MNKIVLSAALAAFAATAGTSPALAKPGHGHGHDNRHAAHVGYGMGNCPPGLAKKNAECMPPGQYKKRYNVGQRLPYGYNSWTPYNQIPYDLRNQYDLDPYGRYVYDNNYLYRVDPTTLVVQQVLNAILR